MQKIKYIFKKLVNDLLSRDAYITITYLSNKDKKILYEFSIFIMTWKTVKIYKNISINEAENIYSALVQANQANKSVEIRVHNKVEKNCYESFLIPKWATKIIARDIKMYVLTA